MQLSKFFRALLSPCAKFYGVFNELKPEPLYLRNDFSSVEEISAEVLITRFGDKAEEHHLVVNAAEEDGLFYQNVKEQVMQKLGDPFILYLNLASGCNFDCSYCPVPGLAEKHGEHTLTTEQANQALSDWYELRFQSGAQTNFIIFYGGEPLLNKPVFKTSLEYLETLESRIGKLKSLDLMIVTNGSLLDSETLDLCKKYGITIVFGIDGVTAEQNQTRLRGKNELTHFAVLNNLQNAVDVGLRVAISLTLTPYNIHSLEWIVMEFLKMGVKEIGFNFLKDAASIPALDSKEKLMHFWKESAAIAYKIGKRYFPMVLEFQYQKKLTAWEKQSFFPLDCTCLGNQVVVQADGYMSNCPFFHREGLDSKSLKTFLEGEQSFLDPFRSSHPLWNPAYSQLPEKALCGQGCTMGMKQSNSDSDEPEIDWSSYFYSQEAFNGYLWDIERNIESTAS